MNNILRIAVGCTAFGLMAVPAQAAESYSAYDNFNGQTEFGLNLWLFGERQRLIKGGVLSVIQRDYGLQTSDTGTLNQTWGADLANPSDVTQMRSSMTVNSAEITGCSTNTTPSTVQLRMVAAFFNVGPTSPTSRIGDVVALARFYRSSDSSDGPGVFKVDGLVVQCTTSDCNYDQTQLGSVDLGTVSTGQTLSMRLEWDAARNRFSFYRGSEPVQRITYVVSDTQPAFLLFRSLGTRTNVASCFGGTRAEAFIDGKFDNLSVNASAAP
jgi:hypothetical protein